MEKQISHAEILIPNPHNNLRKIYQAESHSSLAEVQKIVDRLKKNSKGYDQGKRFQSVQNQNRQFNESVNKFNNRMKTSHDTSQSRRKQTIKSLNQSLNKLRKNKKQFKTQEKQYSTKKPYRYKLFSNLEQQKNNNQFDFFNDNLQQFNQSISQSKNKKFSRTSGMGFIIKKQQARNTEMKILPDHTQMQYKQNLQYLKQFYQCFANLMLKLRSQNKSLIMEQINHYILLVKNRKSKLFEQLIIQISQQKLRKHAFASRLQEYLSIMFIIFEYIDNLAKTYEAHLTNLVGHAASNLIFLSKIYILKFKIDKNETNKYEASIDQYLKESFSQDFESIEEMIPKIQLNNEIIQIIISKFNGKEIFYKRIKEYLKNLEFQPIILKQSFKYLLQYLAIYLHQNQLLGICPQFQLPPTPFLSHQNLNNKKQYTIVIEPYGVLVINKTSRMYVRAYTYDFLRKISQIANIVFWTNLMPFQIDPMIKDLNEIILIEKTLYRYHNNNIEGKLLKNIQMLGRKIDKIIMIDKNPEAYSLNPRHGIEVGWNGTKNDSKLLILYNILYEIIMQGMTIDYGIQRFQLQLKSCKRKQKRV